MGSEPADIEQIKLPADDVIIDRNIDGVAAQLYEREAQRSGRARFWIQLREDTKARWRREAVRKIRTGQIPVRVY